MSQSIVVGLAVLGVLLALLVVVAVLALRDPAASRHRVEALFRKPRKPPKPPGQDHYYRPYWS
jgi:hypothetical protein